MAKVKVNWFYAGHCTYVLIVECLWFIFIDWHNGDCTCTHRPNWRRNPRLVWQCQQYNGAMLPSVDRSCFTDDVIPVGWKRGKGDKMEGQITDGGVCAKLEGRF